MSRRASGWMVWGDVTLKAASEDAEVEGARQRAIGEGASGASLRGEGGAERPGPRGRRPGGRRRRRRCSPRAPSRRATCVPASALEAEGAVGARAHHDADRRLSRGEPARAGVEEASGRGRVEGHAGERRRLVLVQGEEVDRREEAHGAWLPAISAEVTAATRRARRPVASLSRWWRTRSGTSGAARAIVRASRSGAARSTSACGQRAPPPSRWW